MSATPFTLDDITLTYAEEDYKPQRAQPKIGVTFEFEVLAASVEQSRQGHIQAKLTLSALDGEGREMFKKYLNVPLPVSIRDITAPDYAKGMWSSMSAPFFPKLAAYDKIELDAATGKKIYSKFDIELTGKEFDEAVIAQRKALAEVAKNVARSWVEDGDGAHLDQFTGKRVFAKLKHSKDGKYVNVDRMYSEVPAEEEVCYDRNEAMSK